MLASVAVFIGSQACQPCHFALAESYAQTPMARSSGRVDSISLPNASFTANGHSYRIEDNQLIFRESGSEFKVPMDFFIGSGAAGRSFLFSRDRYLFELPVTWYSRKRIWDASPGYERETEVRLNRAIEPTCLFCHSSRVRPIFGTQNRYGVSPFLENGIGCERCHGPGSEHVRHPTDAHMVNPAKLAPALRDSASECKRVSGDKLWCGTCHDPHAGDQSRVTRDRTQSACIGCHPSAHGSDQNRAGNCADCHMPKSQVVDGGHGVLTDHGIWIRRDAAASSAGMDLQSFLGEPDDRAIGLAYAEMGDARARDFLLRAKPADVEVRLRLAALEHDTGRARALYESVLRENPTHPVALVNLGSLYARAGRVEEAGNLWRRALDTNPGIEEAALNLAQVGTPSEARAILTRYLEFNPGSNTARARLHSISSK